MDKNPKWDHFIPQLDNVTKFEMEVILHNPFPLLYLLPNDVKEFYRYTYLIKIVRTTGYKKVQLIYVANKER